MGVLDAVVGPVSKLLDKIIPDPQARDKAKLELLEAAIRRGPAAAPSADACRRGP